MELQKKLKQKTTQKPDYQTIIIGAGFSGIGAAIKLGESGFHDYLLIEQGDGVGGAWHFNTYPGVAVDIPSFSYSFSFEQNPNWSRVFAPGKELKQYAEHCVEKYNISSHLRFNTQVISCDFDEQHDLWQIRTQCGETLTARYLVSATGVLTQPKLPAIEGIENFKGVTMHTARWDHSIDLRNKRVGIIGTGASALQVVPEIAPIVSHLTVFQRTPIWVIPKPDTQISDTVQKVIYKTPLLQSSFRFISQCIVEVGFVLTAHYHKQFGIAKYYEKLALQQLAKQVKDPAIREKLTPKYGFACKRPSASNTYLPTFNRKNVSLITNGINKITETGVYTQNKQIHELDILICATGFKVFENGNMPPFTINGIGGLNLEQWWDEQRYQAYEGVSIPKFPNLFMILGPNGFNGASYFQLIEMQARHILRCIKHAEKNGATRVEITQQANQRYFNEMKARSGSQVFFNNNCHAANSYYFDKHGDVPFRPATSVEAHWRSYRFPLSDYNFTNISKATSLV